MERGLREHFVAAVAKRKSAQNDVEAGRASVEAYVEYIHYVEGVSQAAISAAHGHFPEAEGTFTPGHQHEEK
jgi:hypothetical protein